jgi:hypothetical protein
MAAAARTEAALYFVSTLRGACVLVEAPGDLNRGCREDRVDGTVGRYMLAVATPADSGYQRITRNSVGRLTAKATASSFDHLGLWKEICTAKAVPAYVLTK